ncbi:lantibiotic dehydratase [Kribbella sp. NPDC056861]|uniref:lantibiotic dehydratase n=1 Tax=Kribbella sp. NPDC056861 TaxID=3154857 RepID=UPI003422C686
MTDVLSNPYSPDTGTASGWRLGSGFLLRVAGQPAEAVAVLRTPAAISWTEQVLAAEAVRDAVANQVREALEADLAARDPEDPERVALINLRRDAFNGRRPRPATVSKAEPLLPEQTQVLTRQWVATIDRVRDLLDQGVAVLGDDLAAARARARELLADDKLRSAVLLQSEVLEKNMDRYLDPTRKVDKHGRQVERTLLELLYRAALKTSPFSTLTSVGLGRFSDTATRPRPEPTSLEQRSTVRLNIAVLARLSAVVLADSTLRSGLRVALAPGASSDGETMRYVRRRTASGSDPDAVVAIDNVHEDLFFLPGGPALDDVVTLTREDRPTVTELSRQIAAKAEGRSPEESDQLIGHLLRLGFLLAPDLQIDLRSSDPTKVLIVALLAQDHPTLQQLAASLQAAVDLIDAYPGTPARGRAAVLRDVRDHVRACFELLGASDQLVPRTVIYEDTTITGDGMDVDRGLWERTLLPDLADLADLLPAFDLNVSRRLTAKGFFKARYGIGGDCADVVRFCHEFQRDFFDPYTRRSMRRRQFDDDNAFVPQENWFKLQDIVAVDKAREAASLHLRDLRTADPSEVEEIRLGPDFVDAVRRELPPGEQLAQPWSFFVQLASGDQEPGRLILNQAYAGLTLMFSRFAHSLDTEGTRARDLISEVLRDYSPDGAVLAELRGGYETTNLNVHPAVTQYEIVCPGDASTRPKDEQIALEDLFLVHDAVADRVRLMSTRLGREVVPVYLGFLMPMALPEIQQILLCFSPSGMAQIDLWAGTGDPIPVDGIQSYPRLVLGDLVLQRRMWKLNTSVFPFRDPRHSDAEHLLKVRRWRLDHGLPSRLFAQIDNAAAKSAVDDGAAPDTPDAPETPGAERKAGRKPLPVDFDSWMSLQLLEQLALGASARIVLTEANPDTDELWLTDEHGRPHVCELLLELYDTGRDSDDE